MKRIADAMHAGDPGLGTWPRSARGRVGFLPWRGTRSRGRSRLCQKPVSAKACLAAHAAL